MGKPASSLSPARVDPARNLPMASPHRQPASTLLRARVNTSRYHQAEQVFTRLGLKTSDAINLFLAQVALREDLPFSVTTHPERLISDPEQAKNWNEALGDY